MAYVNKIKDELSLLSFTCCYYCMHSNDKVAGREFARDEMKTEGKGEREENGREEREGEGKG